MSALDTADRGDDISMYVGEAGIANDLGAMLRWLSDAGFKPVLYPETTTQWVCYPMCEVRAWTSTRAADPVGAVRALYLWALEHPNVIPTFPPSLSSALDQRVGPCAAPCRDHAAGLGCPCVRRGFFARVVQVPEALPF